MLFYSIILSVFLVCVPTIISPKIWEQSKHTESYLEMYHYIGWSVDKSIIMYIVKTTSYCVQVEYNFMWCFYS